MIGFPFKGTDAWDEIARLPLFPKTNNGLCYFAYTLRVEEPPVTVELQDQFRRIAVATDFGRKRWMSEIGQSHDEIRGYLYACWYLNLPGLMEPLIAELNRYGGNLKANVTEGMRRNYFRILDMEAQIHGVSDQVPTPLEQVTYALSKVWQAFMTKEGEASGILRTWLYVPVMRRYWICAAGLMIWASVLKFRKIKLYHLLNLEPRVPELAARAVGKGFLD
jgi:hypothetical protein